MSAHLPNPFVFDTGYRFDALFNVEAFMAEIEPAPKFLRDPSPEYLTAIDLMPIVQILTKF